MFELIRADIDRKMRGFGVRPEDLVIHQGPAPGQRR